MPPSTSALRTLSTHQHQSSQSSCWEDTSLIKSSCWGHTSQSSCWGHTSQIILYVGNTPAKSAFMSGTHQSNQSYIGDTPVSLHVEDTHQSNQSYSYTGDTPVKSVFMLGITSQISLHAEDTPIKSVFMLGTHQSNQSSCWVLTSQISLHIGDTPIRSVFMLGQDGGQGEREKEREREG